ncbi:MAG: flagellar hook-associated protein FlgK [Deltaproteobacteria bacterium]
MSISTSLNNAVSGLTVNAKRIELVSSNVANAKTQGYARREAEVVSAQLGGRGDGVRFVGVQRVLNPYVQNDMRFADGSAAGQDLRRTFLAGMTEILGSPDDASSLSGLMTRLESSLSEAAASPSSEARLSAVNASIKSITSFLNGASDQVQTERLRADDDIETQIGSLNTKLQQVADLNRDIRSFSGSGHDTSSLMDQRQLLIDDISQIVPVREIQRDNGQVALMTAGGLQLLDGRPVTIEFTSVSTITADMTVSSGGLFIPTVNGEPLVGGIPGPRLGGGTLEALFDLRDTLAPQAQARLDGFARELVDRFQAPGADPTLATGDPGLFTDGGGPFDPLDEAGLAGRISINPLVDPAQGGALWRVSAGVGAVTLTAAGDATQLLNLGNVFLNSTVPATAAFGGTSRRLADLAGEVISRQSGDLANQETTLSYTQARADSLRARFLEDGVDTDQEMRKLLEIEQAYAANAKVISTVDQLLQQLMGL